MRGSSDLGWTQLGDSASTYLFALLTGLILPKYIYPGTQAQTFSQGNDRSTSEKERGHTQGLL